MARLSTRDQSGKLGGLEGDGEGVRGDLEGSAGCGGVGTLGILGILGMEDRMVRFEGS